MARTQPRSAAFWNHSLVSCCDAGGLVSISRCPHAGKVAGRAIPERFRHLGVSDIRGYLAWGSKNLRGPAIFRKPPHLPRTILQDPHPLIVEEPCKGCVLRRHRLKRTASLSSQRPQNFLALLFPEAAPEEQEQLVLAVDTGVSETRNPKPYKTLNPKP